MLKIYLHKNLTNPPVYVGVVPHATGAPGVVLLANTEYC